MSLTYEVCQESFESLTDQWSELLDSCSNNTVFLTAGWQYTWWSQFRDRGVLCILGIWEQDRLKGLAPLMKYGETLTFLGDTDLVDYHDFLMPGNEITELYAALLEYLVTFKWNVLDLPSIPSSSPMLEILPAWASNRRYSVDVVCEDVSPGMILPSSVLAPGPTATTFPS